MSSTKQRCPNSGFIGDEWTSYAPIIEREIGQVVHRYAQKGAIAPGAREDVAQDLHLKLLENWSAVFSKYDPNRAQLSVYLRVYLRSRLLNLPKKEEKVLMFEYLDICPGSCEEAFGEVFLEDAKMMVNSGLEFLSLSGPKWRLLLKIYAGKCLTINDVSAYAPRFKRAYLRKYVRRFSFPYGSRSDEENMQLIFPLFQEVENQYSEADSVRHLLTVKVSKLRKYLTTHSGYKFDNESVRNLLHVVI